MSAALKSEPFGADLSYVFIDRGSESVRSALPELAVVRLLEPARTFDGSLVPAGRVGTIVAVHDGGAAYDVEFTEPVRLASVGPQDIARVED